VVVTSAGAAARTGPDVRPDLRVRLGPLALLNPITLASGTCGYGVELAEALDLSALGCVFTKGLTLAPREGNPPPRIAETASGMINRIGLQNVGVEQFIVQKLPPLVAIGLPVVANLAGATREEYVELAARLDGVPGLAGLELNVSCPNVDAGGIEFGTEPAVLERLVACVRARTSLPLVVKLTANGTATGELARAAEAGGADALSAVNTLTALAVAPRLEGGRLVASTVRGGLSGPALKPVALRCVADARRATRLPIVGIGGIASLADVLEFLAVGASAVQIGTATFIEPGIAARLARELEAWLLANGVARLADMLADGGPR
jgi:dihydroorotate dehydrogenase (NAD+) catalytic subunit